MFAQNNYALFCSIFEARLKPHLSEFAATFWSSPKSKASLHDLYEMRDQASAAAKKGVEVYVAVSYDAATSKYVYAVTSDVYGTGGGASVATTPIPPGSLRARVPLVYGLVADFDVDTSITPTTGRGAKFAWRLPTCTVTQEQAADVDYESKECGGRGVCNRGTGVCACHTGYGGYSCSQQAIVL